MDGKTATNGAPAKQGKSTSDDEMRLQLQCPKCKTGAWIEWRKLPHLLQCRNCRNSFWIDKSGHIQSEHQAGSGQMVCPRCQVPREMPKGVVLKNFRCSSCGFEGSGSAASSASSLNDRLSATYEEVAKSTKAKREDKPVPRSTSVAVMVGLAVVVCVAVIASIWMFKTDTALVEAVQTFNSEVLAGKGKAAGWVPFGEDRAFENWSVMNSCNRPPAGQPLPVIEVRVVSHSSSTALVRVSYKRTVRDTCEIFQSWKRGSDDRWLFDPTATLQRPE